MFQFVSQSEEENFDEEAPLEYVHLVTTNAFDIAKAFRYRTDALFYAFDFISQMGAAPALKYKSYRQAYICTGMVVMRSSDVNCNVAATIRKTEIRRQRCYAKARL